MPIVLFLPAQADGLHAVDEFVRESSSLLETVVSYLEKPLVTLIVICEDGERDCFLGLAEEVVDAPHTGSQQPIIEAIRRVTGERQGKIL